MKSSGDSVLVFALASCLIPVVAILALFGGAVWLWRNL